jgi:hypothetical protein
MPCNDGSTIDYAMNERSIAQSRINRLTQLLCLACKIATGNGSISFREELENAGILDEAEEYWEDESATTIESLQNWWDDHLEKERKRQREEAVIAEANKRKALRERALMKLSAAECAALDIKLEEGE